VRALNHPGPAGDVRLHSHRDRSGAGGPGRGRVSAAAGRTARRQAARQGGRCDDAQDSGCPAHRKSAPLLPQGHALAQRKARAGRHAVIMGRHFDNRAGQHQPQAPRSQPAVPGGCDPGLRYYAPQSCREPIEHVPDAADPCICRGRTAMDKHAGWGGSPSMPLHEEGRL